MVALRAKMDFTDPLVASEFKSEFILVFNFIFSQFHYATRTPSPVRLVLKVTLFCYCIVQRFFFVFGEY